MASPFHLFRKYKATLLVIAGVLLMFVFVIGDPLMSYMGSSADSGGGGGGQNARDVAVRWDGGKLTNAELGQLVMRRRIVNEFIQQVEYFGRMAAFEAGHQPPPLRVEVLLLPERPDQNVEQDIVRMAVFADAARETGMRISDEQVIRYLRQLGRGYVSTDHLREIIARLRVGLGGASVDYVLDALREEMLARNYLASHMFALDTVLPEQRWEDWLDVNDRVTVEAAAIPTDSFLVDVPEPTEEELTAYFDEYKDREPRPDLVGGIEMPSPQPGFAVPRKIELQFVRADYELFLEKALADVTDDEIEKYYEENKDPYFIRAATDLLDRAASETSVDASEGDAEEDVDADAAGQSDQAADEAEETGSRDADADGSELETDSETGAEPADGDQSSTERSRERNVFRLVAFAEEAEADADATVESTDQGEEVATGDEPAAEDSATDAVEPAEKPKEFQPLEEVRDQIRREIAQLKVSEHLEQMMGKLESELGAKYATHLGAVLDADELGKELPPPPPELADLTELAESHGLEYQKTAPISALELRELPVGLSHKPDEETVPFLYLAFGRDLERYQPVATFDSDNNRYLVMKTSDTPGSVPKLEDIREDVASAWRRQRAAELALKHAQAEAKEAESAESLQEFFADDQRVTVTKTDPFALYTAGTVSRQTGDVQSFRLSKPDGIESADFELMETIFGLGDGEVGAALNHDHSIAYLLRIIEHEQTPSELQQAFLSEADSWYGLAIMNRAHSRQAMQVLLVDMLESAGVDWQRDPDQPNREEQ